MEATTLLFVAVATVVSSAMWYAIDEIAYSIGRRVPMSRLGAVIQKAMRRGHRSHIRLRSSQTRGFVDFYKLILPDGSSRFVMTVPRRYCSEVHFEAAAAAVQRLGVSPEVALMEELIPRGFFDCGIRSVQRPEWLVVDCDMNLQKAVDAAFSVLVEAFGVVPERNIRVSTFRSWLWSWGKYSAQFPGRGTESLVGRQSAAGIWIQKRKEILGEGARA